MQAGLTFKKVHLKIVEITENIIYNEQQYTSGRTIEKLPPFFFNITSLKKELIQHRPEKRGGSNETHVEK